MTKKSNAPVFTVVRRGEYQLSDLHVAFGYNASRDGIDSFEDLLGMTKSEKAPVVGKKSQDLLGSQLSPRGFTNIEIMIVSPIGVSPSSQKADLKRFGKEHSAQLKEMASLTWFKGEKGAYTYRGVEVEVTNEDLQAEQKLTFPNPPSSKTKAVISGNRRLAVLVVRNAIVRKAGFLDDVVTTIVAEERSYASARARDDDSIYLNESGKQGKLESTKLQKLGAAFKKLMAGAVQADFNRIFAGNRGVVQLVWDIVACWRIVSWVDSDAANEIKASLLSGETAMPNQGKLARLRAFRMQAEHSDGHTPEFQADGPGARKANAKNSKTHFGSSAIAKQKAHVKAHPEIAERLRDYFRAIKDPNYVDVDGKKTKVSSMASATLQTVAAGYDGTMIETLLNVAAGVNKDHELKDVADALQARINELEAEIERLAEPVFLRDKDDELTARPLIQKDVDKLCTQLEKARKSSGRKAKVS